MHAGKFISASDISSINDDIYRYPCIGGNGIRGYVKNYNTEGESPIIGRQGALCGNINYIKGKFYATEHAVVVDTFCGVNVNWAYYFLIQLDLNQYATATAQPGLSVNTIGDVQIPVPPLAEQERIVKAIEQYFDCIDLIEYEKEDLQKYIWLAKTKILELAIRGKLLPQNPNDEPAIDLLKRINPKFEPCDNAHYTDQLPIGWCSCKVGMIANIIGGVSYKKDDVQEKGIRILRGGNIQDGLIVVAEDDVFVAATYSDEEKTVMRGDIVVVASTGSSTLIGKTGFATKDYNQTQIGAFLRIIRPNKLISSDFINIIFLSDEYKSYIRNIAKGSNINNLKNNYLTGFVISLPPINEQYRIIEKTKILLDIIEEIQKSLEA